MADLDDLKSSWQKERGISQERFDQIGNRVSAGSDLLRKTIFHRDMKETFASLVVIAFFVPGMLRAKTWLECSSFAVTTIAVATIPFVLWWARRRPNAELSATSFLEFVDVEIGYLGRQVLLLRMVGWWYILPIYLGVAMFVLSGNDRRSSLPVALVVLFLIAGLYIYIWWMNRKVCKNDMQPLLDYYVQLRVALESDGDLDMELTEPPIAFLQSTPKRISKRRRLIGILLAVIVTASVLLIGFWLAKNFDKRTGNFIASCAPVVGILIVVLTGAWRKPIANASE